MPIDYNKPASLVKRWDARKTIISRRLSLCYNNTLMGKYAWSLSCRSPGREGRRALSPGNPAYSSDMGEIKNPIPAKLFAGMISSDPALFDECAGMLSAEYGAIDFASDVKPWNITDYYRDEMGPHLYRKFIFFNKLIDPGALSSIKIFTNSIEKRLFLSAAAGSRRRINIDPGYVTEAKVVLASTKDFSHRLYIGGNIYAEVTLSYSSSERSFMHLPHTYFDFRMESYKMLFNAARDMLREALKRSQEP